MISSQAFAATLLNGGFELPNATGLNSLSGAHDNWDYTGVQFQAGVVDQNNATFCPALAAAEGNQFAYLWCGVGDETAQNITGFTIGATYHLQWSAAGRAVSGTGGVLKVVLDGSTEICAPYIIPNDETWRQTNIAFTATATSHRIRFIHSGIWDRMIFVDDVALIPEPATFGLLALVGLAFLRRK